MNDRKSGAKFFYCIKCIEIIWADHEVCRKRGLMLRNPLGNVLVHKYCKPEVQEEQLTAKEKFKVFG